MPTWNYLAVHIYGKAATLHETDEILELMDRTMIKYEPAYHDKWLRLPNDFKNKMLKGIVAFQIDVTEIQGKAKLSQNKTAQEIEHIIDGLAASTAPNEPLLAEYIERYARKP